MSATRTIDGATVPQAGTWVLDPAHTTIGFWARHLMVTKVRGTFEDYTGTITVGDDLGDSSVEIRLDAASITTGNADRDRHLHSPDFLDVDNHKHLIFSSTSVEVDGTSGTIHGELTVRDETRPLSLDFEFLGMVTDPWGNAKAAFSATGELTREEWGLSWNVPLADGGVLVSKKVTLEIETQLQQAS